MIRRSFRVGLWLGILGGIVFAVLKTVQGRRPLPGPSAARLGPPETWPPLQPPAPVRPEPALTDPLPDPGPTPVPPPQPEPIPEPTPVEPPPPLPDPMPAIAEPVRAEPVKKAVKKKAAAPKPAPAKPWVDPEGGLCPSSHPVKAKLASSIFHLPGMLNYVRCAPDRCYASAEAAEADGLRAAKR